jgi:hypothetical protein
VLNVQAMLRFGLAHELWEQHLTVHIPEQMCIDARTRMTQGCVRMIMRVHIQTSACAYLQ